MVSKRPAALRLNPADNVIVALAELEMGTEVPSEKVTAAEKIPSGHKMAAVAIHSGDPIKKYGQIIGFAGADIKPGQHVHTHNVAMGEFTREHAFGADAGPNPLVRGEPATFDGIVRPDGRIATRNYIGIVSSVNCSASVCRFIADRFRGDALAAFPNVDGVVPIIHGTGCAIAGQGEEYDYLMNAVNGFIRHPNFAGVVLVGLGCEVLQVDEVMHRGGFTENRFFSALTGLFRL